MLTAFFGNHYQTDGQATRYNSDGHDIPCTANYFNKKLYFNCT